MIDVLPEDYLKSSRLAAISCLKKH